MYKNIVELLSDRSQRKREERRKQRRNQSMHNIMKFSLLRAFFVVPEGNVQNNLKYILSIFRTSNFRKNMLMFDI